MSWLGVWLQLFGGPKIKQHKHCWLEDWQVRFRSQVYSEETRSSWLWRFFFCNQGKGFWYHLKNLPKLTTDGWVRVVTTIFFGGWPTLYRLIDGWEILCPVLYIAFKVDPPGFPSVISLWLFRILGKFFSSIISSIGKAPWIPSQLHHSS